MTTFLEALDALGDLVVPGVTNNYKVDTAPLMLSRPQLPALLVLLTFKKPSKQFGQAETKGFENVAFTNATRQVYYHAFHLLLVCSITDGLANRVNNVDVVTLTDAYVAAIVADLTLGGVLHVPTQLTVTPGRYEYGGIVYHGTLFEHLMRAEL